MARQYSGTAGRRENQQIGVFLAYASEAGCAFVDRELYVPQEWFDDLARCQQARIPPDRTFATKPQLAQQMLERAFAAAVPARWVVGDCIYSSEELRQWLEAQEQAYLFAVTSTHAIWEQGEQIVPLTSSPGIPSWDGCAGRQARAAKGRAAMIGRGCACPTRVLLGWRIGC